MNTRDEERLHERLMDGMADPGMYPECAEHVGMIDRGPQPPYEPQPEEICAAQGHPYHGDDGDMGRCYCGTNLYPPGGPR